MTDIPVKKEAEPISDICEWVPDDINYGVWDSQCGQKWILTDGTPKDNEFNFCPACGRTLVERLQ